MPPLIRMHAFTSNDGYLAFAQKTLEAFAGIAPQIRGLFAATYGLQATAFRASSDAKSVIYRPRRTILPRKLLEDAAHRVYRLGKSVLR